jgi:preprotein translocase subunit YajC
MENLWILAQTGSPGATTPIPSEPVGPSGQSTTATPGSPTPTPDNAAPPRSSSPYTGLLLMVAVFVVMYMVLLRGPRKQQQQQKQMVQSLKKNDRVRTIGGIYGTVMDVKGDEVVLKIDEATNTKIHVSVSAIGKNLSQEGKE